MASEKEAGRYPFAESSPFALLVHAANAQAQEKANGESGGGSTTEVSRAIQEASAQMVAAQVESQQQQSLNQMELREALHRQALEQEVLRQRATLLGLGGAGALAAQGLAPQEAEYLQQLRLEALVQQRRQETLAQLALAQELGVPQDMQALQQLQQAELIRQEMLASENPQNLEQLAAARMGGNEEVRSLQQYLEQRQQQLRSQAPPTVQSMEGAGAESQLMSESPGSPAGKSMMTERDPVEASTGATTVGDVVTQPVESTTTILPCRARGMPMDHNVKTAYFTIPEDIKHGTELVCSYQACRNAGIKFRYCTYCKLPVAKRNFCKRHKHAGKIPSSKLAEGTLDDDESDMSPTNGKSSGAEGTIPTSVQVKKINASGILDLLILQGSREVEASEVNGGIVPSIEEMLPKEELHRRVAERRERWDLLLEKRPQTPQELVAWAQQVLTVSDLGTPREGANMYAGTENPEAKAAEGISVKVSAPKGSLLRENGNSELPVERDVIPKAGAEEIGRGEEKGDMAAPKRKDAPIVREPPLHDALKAPDPPNVTTGTLADQGEEEMGDEDEEMNEEATGEADSKGGDVSVASSTSSDDSVDLRARKKAKT